MEKIVLEVAVIPITIGWSGFEAVLNIFHQVEFERLKLDSNSIAITEGQFRLAAGQTNAALTKQHIRLGNAPELLARVGGAVVLRVGFEKFLIFLHGLPELLARLEIKCASVLCFRTNFALRIFCLQFAEQSERALRRAKCVLKHN